MVQSLLEKGEIIEGILKDYYVIFMVGIFCLVCFGVSFVYGKVNMICFNYFVEVGVFDCDEQGLYSVNMDKMFVVVVLFSECILILQGDGDYVGVVVLVVDKGVIKLQLVGDFE